MRHDGLCEYISRATRIKLLKLLLKKFSSTRWLAKELGVSHTAVNKWLRPGDAHPSNDNLLKIIELAAEFNINKISKILTMDLVLHEKLLERFVTRS